MTPLQNVKVLNLGTRWAGRVAAILLADQGAEVIEITAPGAEPHPCDALLGRGKRLVELNLKSSEDSEHAQDLATKADIVLENMRAGAAERLGLGAPRLCEINPLLTYVSLPGFAPGDPRYTSAAWEGSINAASGVYTDLSPLGPLLGRAPVFSAIPMASAYGGVLGAVTATLGFYHRLTTGTGQHFTVPLADAVMSAMALLIAKVEGQPNRYDFPPIERSMREVAFPILHDLSDHLSDDHVADLLDYVRSFASPMLASYPAADGRLVFLNANDHMYQSRALLQTLGIFDRLIAEGMTATSPYAEGSGGNNLFKAASLTPAWRQYLRAKIGEAMLMAPAETWEQRLRDANVPVTIVRTTEEWLAVPSLRAGGVTTDLNDPIAGEVRQAGRFLSLAGNDLASPPLQPRKKAPSNEGFQTSNLTPSLQAQSKAGLLTGVKVLDLSNIIAGPAAGRTLAEFGAEVIRIDAPRPQAGPFATMWFGIDVNQGKRAIILDLKIAAGRQAFARLLADADVVLHNFLDRSAERLGIDHASLAAIKPDVISCQISAWGGSDGGPYKDDPAFDPVLQAASGIMTRYGTPERPVLHGIASCVDYMTGFLATLGIVQALASRALGRGGSEVRTSLAMAAQLVQFPFMASAANAAAVSEPSGQQARGSARHQSLYRFADGWAYLGCTDADSEALCAKLGIAANNTDDPAAVLRELPIAEARQRITAIGSASICDVSTLAAIRAERTEERGTHGSNWLSGGSFVLVRGEHPSGLPTTLPRPTWIRPEHSPIQELAPAPSPGTHTEEVLREAGMSHAEIASLLESGAARTAWPVLTRYLPD